MKGFSLLEVLIAVLVLSTGILGIASTEIILLKGMQRSFSYTIASIQAQNLLELYRANHNTAGQVFSIWQQETQRLLPNSNSRYQCNITKCQVIINFPKASAIPIQLNSVISPYS